MASTLNIAANIVLKASPGKVLTITGVGATNTGTLNDATTIGGGAPICALPASQQALYLNWKTYAGIVVNITAGAVSVDWE